MLLNLPDVLLTRIVDAAINHDDFHIELDNWDSYHETALNLLCVCKQLCSVVKLTFKKVCFIWRYSEKDGADDISSMLKHNPQFYRLTEWPAIYELHIIYQRTIYADIQRSNCNLAVPIQAVLHAIPYKTLANIEHFDVWVCRETAWEGLTAWEGFTHHGLSTAITAATYCMRNVKHVHIWSESTFP